MDGAYWGCGNGHISRRETNRCYDRESGDTGRGRSTKCRRKRMRGSQHVATAAALCHRLSTHFAAVIWEGCARGDVETSDEGGCEGYTVMEGNTPSRALVSIRMLERARALYPRSTPSPLPAPGLQRRTQWRERMGKRHFYMFEGKAKFMDSDRLPFFAHLYRKRGHPLPLPTREVDFPDFEMRIISKSGPNAYTKFRSSTY